MLVRNGWVSNSSSSSFVIYVQSDNHEDTNLVLGRLNGYLDAVAKISPFVKQRYRLNDRGELTLYVDESDSYDDDVASIVKDLQDYISRMGVYVGEGRTVEVLVFDERS